MACDPGHALRVLGVCSCRRRSNADGNQHFDLTTEYELIGSRYAVVLCCSRSGRPGPAYVSLNASSGASRLAKTCVHGQKVCILILFVCQRRRDEHYSCVDVVRSTVVRDTGVTRVGINRLSAVLRGTRYYYYTSCGSVQLKPPVCARMPSGEGAGPFSILHTACVCVVKKGRRLRNWADQSSIGYVE